MVKYYYCLDCRQISESDMNCIKCNSAKVKILKEGAPMNVTGTKQKGRVFKIKENNISLLVKNEFNEQSIKEFKPQELQKVL